MRDLSILPPLSATGPGRVDSPEPAEASAPGWAALLDWCYRRAGLALPRLEQLPPEAVPQPYRTLLAHSADMTPTLEGFFRQRVSLTVLSRELQGDSYRREVVLTLGNSARPILYGAIHILLGHLPPAARQCVRDELYPLGHILQAQAVPHMSWPQAFFRAEPDPHLAARLRLRRSCELFGRRNVLLNGSRRLLAEVIEVLAPVQLKNQVSPGCQLQDSGPGAGRKE